jgi:hypothetical protein
MHTNTNPFISQQTEQTALLNQLMIPRLNRQELVLALTSFWVLTITYEFLHTSHGLFVLFCGKQVQQNRIINISDMVDFIEKQIIQTKFGPLFSHDVKFKSFQFENKTTSQSTGEVFCWALKGQRTEAPNKDKCFTFQLCLNNNPNQIQTLALWGVPKKFDMGSTSTRALKDFVSFSQLFTQTLTYEGLMFQCVGIHRQRIPYLSQKKNEQALKQTIVTHVVPDGFRQKDKLSLKRKKLHFVKN